MYDKECKFDLLSPNKYTIRLERKKIEKKKGKKGKRLKEKRKEKNRKGNIKLQSLLQTTDKL